MNFDKLKGWTKMVLITACSPFWPYCDLTPRLGVSSRDSHEPRDNSYPWMSHWSCWSLGIYRSSSALDVFIMKSHIIELFTGRWIDNLHFISVSTYSNLYWTKNWILAIFWSIENIRQWQSMSDKTYLIIFWRRLKLFFFWKKLRVG